MNTLKDRLTAALEEKTLGSQAEMARECGVTNSAVSFWFNGKTKALRGKNLINAARYLGVEPSWINEGPGLKPVRPSQKAEDARTYVSIRNLSIEATEVPGAPIVLDDAAPLGHLAFRRDWLNQKGLNPERLLVHEATLESMAPFIRRGDLVLVDTQPTAPANDEVWAIADASSLCIRIKRVLIRERGDWILRCDHSDKVLYEDEVIPASLVHELTLLGKVVWRGG